MVTMTQAFECRIVVGNAHWITSLVHEPAASRLVIELSDEEGSFEPTCAIEFIEVQRLESRWSDRDEGAIEGLLGAHEEELAGLARYLIVTDQREIEVLARRKAVVRREARNP
jgi:hypothetical protein